MKTLRESDELQSLAAIVPNTVYFIDRKPILKKLMSEISQMVEAAYSKIGGYAGDSSARALLKNTDRAKAVFDTEKQLLAIALYRTDLGGFKRFCSAAKQRAAAKDAAKLIVKDDILPYDNWYWVEASGAIEKLFKENNGNPIPNWLAAEFLRIEPAKLQLDPDGVHYVRAIGLAKSPKKKMIFGFKDKASALKACAAVASYDDFKLQANKLFEDDSMTDIACQVIRQIFELHDEWKCNEMLPAWKEAITKAVDEVQQQLSTSKDYSKLRMLKGILARAKTCLSEMPLLAVHQLHVR